MSTLIIVESPAKAKKIQTYLSKDYTVLSSYGHICNLDRKKGQNAVEVDNNFNLIFSNLPDKKQVISKLIAANKKVKNVIIATDEDREGEAIGYHLIKLLKLDLKNTPRIIFNEITKDAIINAIKNPEKLRMNFVNAQFGRMALDHIVGFRLSPLLWKNIKGPVGLSAGRVQSLVVKLIIDREIKIDNFKEEGFYKIIGEFIYNSNVITAQIKDHIENYMKILKLSLGQIFLIKNIEEKKIERKPPPPYTTSSLQQDISSSLNISTKQVMQIAQNLYEDGHITYHRTDSVNLSKDFLTKSKNYIIKEFGTKYSNVKNFKNNSTNAQEAHEAIRPTKVECKSLNTNELKNKVYNYIWKRAIASQMSNQIINNIILHIGIDKYEEIFITSIEETLFEGFKILYNHKENKELIKLFKKCKIGDKLTYKTIKAEQQFTNTPDRYTEATLVKNLEKKGIGRPSTYASMIEKVQDKKYIIKANIKGKKRQLTNYFIDNKKLYEEKVEKEEGVKKNKLVSTDLGKRINKFLVSNFGDSKDTELMNYNFTANLEMQLDLVLEDKIKWKTILKNFYKDFFPIYNKLNMSSSKQSNDFDEGRFIGNHPKTNERITVRVGQYGKVAQIGEYSKTKKTKPKFINIENFDLDTVTLDDILEKEQFPKKIGRYQDNDIIIFDGQYGYYIKWNGNNCSMYNSEKKNIDSINQEKGIEIIKRKLNSKKGPLKTLLGGKVTINESKFESKNKHYLTYKEGFGKPTYISIPNNIDIAEIDDIFVKRLLKLK